MLNAPMLRQIWDDALPVVLEEYARGHGEFNLDRCQAGPVKSRFIDLCMQTHVNTRYSLQIHKLQYLSS
ncbi:hypothetical protein Dthio_PD2256 [Desulfonatronospira thiodismutans ASO3-1]|uniref:Uncharacterized protein n=1 Tax=Desulfonatronospira thiodismutans ASO3-1 TaxID=555779 RepID=D6SQ39_9BACT|nr:hypothetical protein Dthio_PD2256 [Desulfonatronospira thiodismutans ASO3-1]